MQLNPDGVLIIDKPEGMTSAKAVARVKKALKVKKIGHSGTLDPFATGVLVCLLNRATKIARFFLHGDKAYQARLRLGVETDTHDPTGMIVARKNATEVSKEAVLAAFSRFSGEILQAPPAFSALKQDGVPLYELARKGRKIQKPPRKVRIFELAIEEIALPDVRFRVHCSGGTYIRSLAADIGEALGYGAHLRSLRRTRSGRFELAQAVTLPELEDVAADGTWRGHLISVNDAMGHLPALSVGPNLARRIGCGAPVGREDFPPPGPHETSGRFRVTDAGNRLLAIMEAADNRNDYVYCCVFEQREN